MRESARGSEALTFRQMNIKDIDKELKFLRNKGYRGVYTADDDSKKKSLEYEFEDAYAEPEKALALLIEKYQLKRERQGLKRVKIVTFEEASVIRDNKPRSGQFAQSTNSIIVPQQQGITESSL